MGDGSHDKPGDTTPHSGTALRRRDLLVTGGSLAAAMSVAGFTSPAQAQQVQAQLAPVPTLRPGQWPNIVYIMGDDIGWFNVGAYHRGMMSGKTPNLDRLASQGMLFTGVLQPGGSKAADRRETQKQARAVAALRACEAPRRRLAADPRLRPGST